MCLFLACEKMSMTIAECDEPVIVSEDQFKNAPSDNMIISKAVLQGDCLRIRFGAGGCNGKSWQTKLVASEKVYYSNPPQVDLRLSLEDNEDCEAFITREISFDVSKLRSSGGAVLLNVLNADTTLMYEY